MIRLRTLDIPSPWMQIQPRAVLLAPDGLLVPASTLRVLLGRGRSLDLVVRGFAHRPCLADGRVIRVEGVARPRPGDLALCNAGGWGDLRRILAPAAGGWVTALDALPRARGVVPDEAILGVIRGVPWAGGLRGGVAVLLFPLWSRVGRSLAWWSRVLGTPFFGDGAGASVRDKYAQQVSGYTERIDTAMSPEALAIIGRVTPRGGAVLVGGSGAGGEVIRLAREGYRMTGIDFIPAMVEAGRRNAVAAGISAEFLEQDLVSLDLTGRRFDTAYLTPLVYSFIAGRQTRVRALTLLGRHLHRGGQAVFSAEPVRTPLRLLECLVVWARARLGPKPVEFGDWCTWFLTPSGALGRSYLHRFPWRTVEAEARDAGFRRVRRVERAHFVASEFTEP